MTFTVVFYSLVRLVELVGFLWNHCETKTLAESL